MLKKILELLIVVIAVLFAGIQFVRPAKTNPLIDESRTIEARHQVPPQVGAILKRSCMDCHSHKTEWPWYSHIAPASWFLVEHVNEGRDELNFSDWASYDRDEAEHLLLNICRTVDNEVMPLPSYTPLHPSARLTREDVGILCAWTNEERRRLASTTLIKPADTVLPSAR